MMRRVRRAASIAAWQIGFLAAVLGALGGVSPAGATGLRVGARIEQEMNSPLIPVTRHFRMCFRAQADGTPMLTLCAEPEGRLPAGRPTEEQKKPEKPGPVKAPRPVR